MPLDLERPVTVADENRRLDFPEKTGGSTSESYYGTATGEGVWVGRAVVQRGPSLQRRPPGRGQRGQERPLPATDVRRAFRKHWNEAQEAAEAMHRAAKANDLMGLGVAADRLDQSLAELWKLREGRDVDWQTILNHVQGMMRCFFLERRAETLTADQCKKIVDLVKDYLGPATKTVDDLTEALRLIEDAGFDPFAAISGDSAADESD